MSTETPLTEEQALHRKLGVSLFNHVWTLLDKAELTDEEADEMVNATHASLYHWSKVGTPVNFARGNWQIARVYTVLNRAEPALYHAHRCLQICQDNGIGDFDLAFAYEALARAYAVDGHESEVRRYLELGKEAGEKIAKEGEKKHFFSDLVTVPGYSA